MTFPELDWITADIYCYYRSGPFWMMTTMTHEELWIWFHVLGCHLLSHVLHTCMFLCEWCCSVMNGGKLRCMKWRYFCVLKNRHFLFLCSPCQRSLTFIVFLFIFFSVISLQLILVHLVTMSWSYCRSLMRRCTDWLLNSALKNGLNKLLLTHHQLLWLH